MAVRRVLRSLGTFPPPALPPLLSGLESGCRQSSRQARHSHSLTKQYLSTVKTQGEWSPSCCSKAPERLRTIPGRTFATFHKEVGDRQEIASVSSSSVPLETSADLHASTSPDPGTETSVSESETPSVNLAVDSAFRASPRHDMALLFTCTVCDVRSAKTMSKATYETGVVIVRCPGCQNLHLIADRYGWFGEPGSVEDFLAAKGLDVRKGSDSTYEFTVEDISGWTPKGKSAH